MVNVSVHTSPTYEPEFEMKEAGSTKWLEITTNQGQAAIFLTPETRTAMIAALMTPEEAQSYAMGQEMSKV